MNPIDFPLLALCLAGSVAGGLVIFHATAGYYYVRYYLRRADEGQAWKCQPERWLRPEQQREAALLSTANMTMAGLVSGSFIYAMTQGLPHAIYFEVAERGWLYTVLSALALFVYADAAAYYVHRGLHIRFLFKAVHRHHHRYVATSPYVTAAMHPVEMLALQVSTLLPVFFVPLHAGALAAVLVYILVFNIVDHSGVRLVSSLPWQGPSMYHDDHHKYFHCNFGQHLMIWDRLHGTLRRQKRTYGADVFGGKGQLAGADGPATEPFVDY